MFTYPIIHRIVLSLAIYTLFHILTSTVGKNCNNYFFYRQPVA